MMRKIANTILCYGIAVILLFFGMSFDEAEALFHTQNVRNESVATFVYTSGATISEVEAFGTQIVGMRSETSVQQLIRQSSTGKKDSRMLFCMLPITNLLGDYSDIDKATDVVVSPDIRHRVAVLNYIHDIDGKKRV